MAMGKEGNQPTQPAKEDPKDVRVQQQEAETAADLRARTSLMPTVQAALTLMDYNKDFGEMSINVLVTDLGKQCELASKGDLARTETLLMAQAHTLDAIFHKLARKATDVEYLNRLDANLRLALKAQSQCRATLETLAAIKNPQPMAFVRQANIAHGPQQVNNAGTAQASRAGNPENQPNKVLEHQHGERLDFGAPGAAGGADSHLAAVGENDRTEDAAR
jgi:hypothetical protein